MTIPSRLVDRHLPGCNIARAAKANRSLKGVTCNCRELEATAREARTRTVQPSLSSEGMALLETLKKRQPELDAHCEAIAAILGEAVKSEPINELEILIGRARLLRFIWKRNVTR